MSRTPRPNVLNAADIENVWAELKNSSRLPENQNITSPNIKESDIQSQRSWLIFFPFYLPFPESGYKVRLAALEQHFLRFSKFGAKRGVCFGGIFISGQYVPDWRGSKFDVTISGWVENDMQPRRQLVWIYDFIEQCVPEVYHECFCRSVAACKSDTFGSQCASGAFHHSQFFKVVGWCHQRPDQCGQLNDHEVCQCGISMRAKRAFQRQSGVFFEHWSSFRFATCRGLCLRFPWHSPFSAWNWLRTKTWIFRPCSI